MNDRQRHAHLNFLYGHVILYSNLVPILIVYCGIAATLRDVWLVVARSKSTIFLNDGSLAGWLAGWQTD